MMQYKESTDKSGAQRCRTIYQTKLDSAKWFIDAIGQRQETLFCNHECDLALSGRIFYCGDETKFKPMILRKTLLI
jgi:RNA polymerase sigma-54 factor